MNSCILTTLRKGSSQTLRSQIRSSLLPKSAIILPQNYVFNNDTNIIHVRNFSSLPYHLVVGMPALSPTMEAGTISSWKVGEGESFSAGDSLAEIETDKATIDFEAQDDGVVAKILVEAGSGEINVGVPILVTVEEEDDVGAFKDFVAPEAETAAPAEVEAEPTPVVEEPVKEVVPEPVVAAAAPVATPEPAAPAPAPAVPEPAVATEVAAPVDAAMISPGWGNFAKVKSPLASTLSASQKKYIELYGSTGQVPL